MGQNGGKRVGAGRKRKAVTDAKKNFAADILDDQTEALKWDELIDATRTFYPSEDSGPVTEPDFRIRLDAMRYLCDQKYGKAAQSVHVDGDITLSLAARRERISNAVASLRLAE